MKYLFACILSLFCLFADAKVVASVNGDSGDKILLSDEQCADTPFYKFVVQDGKAVVLNEGCWFIHGTTVILMTKSGAVGLAPGQAFEWNEQVEKSSRQGHNT